MNKNEYNFEILRQKFSRMIYMHYAVEHIVYIISNIL